MPKRIIIHHTAGLYQPNSIDTNAYHYLITDTGGIVQGKFTVEDNENCTDGKYAAHTLKGNTGSIGIAACCNIGFSLSKPKATNYPLTSIQFNTICKLCAKMCIKYSINPNMIFTHYGFDKFKGIKQGKVDITYLPFKPELNPDQVQQYFREKIKQCLNKSQHKV